MNLAIVFLISAHVAVAADPTQAAFEVTEKRWRTSRSRKRNWTGFPRSWCS